MLKSLHPDEYRKEMDQRGKRIAAQARQGEAEFRQRAAEKEKRLSAVQQGEIDKFGKNDRALQSYMRRKHQGGDEPRDPSELEKRRAMEPEFKAAGQAAAARRKAEIQRQKRRLPVKTFRSPIGPAEPADLIQMAQDAHLDPETKQLAIQLAKRGKKKALISLFKKSKQKMAANESYEFSISELFEGFENSWEIDTPVKEEEWEDAKISTKNWVKELTLESILKIKK